MLFLVIKKNKSLKYFTVVRSTIFKYAWVVVIKQRIQFKGAQLLQLENVALKNKKHKTDLKMKKTNSVKAVCPNDIQKGQII